LWKAKEAVSKTGSASAPVFHQHHFHNPTIPQTHITTSFSMYSPETDPFYQPEEPPGPESVTDPETIISADTRRENRIPPGQTRTKKWPVLHAMDVPETPLDRWRLEITGLVETPLRLTWDEFGELPRTKVFADFHCVTTWSRLGNLWEGVSAASIIERAQPRAEARFVVATGYDSGYTTNLPLGEFTAEDVLLATHHDGEPLTAEHGGPLRLIVPKLYAWKSAKWLRRLTFIPTDDPGYWEDRGYHDHGCPWNEERFGGEAPESYWI